MKKFLFPVLFISTFAVAQTEQPIVPSENPKPKHEFGLNLFSITDLRREPTPVDTYNFTADYTLFSGVYYKYHFGKNAIRSSVDFSQKPIIVNLNPAYSYYFSEAAQRDFVGLKAGYEREFGNKKVKAYVFSDLVFNYKHEYGLESYSGCFGWGERIPFNEERFEYGIAGGGGIRYQLSKHLAISYEFSAQEYCSVYQDILHSGRKWVDSGHHLNPVSKVGFAVTF